MKQWSSLPADKLRAKLPPERIPFESSEEIPRNGKRHAPQERVRQALELGLHITAPGFHIYLAGEADLGRTFLLRDSLVPRAKKGTTPPDLVYVSNFDNRDAPKLIALPPGQGQKLKTALAKVFLRIQKEVSLRLERNTFIQQRSRLMDSFHTQRDSLLKQMNKVAVTQGFNLGMDENGGMTLSPLVDGKRLNEQEFESLEEEHRKALRIKGDSLIEPMTGFLRKLAKAEQHFLDAERSLERKMVEEALVATLDPLVEKTLVACESEERPNQALRDFLNALRADLLENTDFLMPPDMPPQQQSVARQSLSSGPPQDHSSGPPQDTLGDRFQINLFVNNANTTGAPIIFADHPTLSNLMGSIEREAEMGALITDLTLIKAGDIHRANGGYLVLRMEDMLRHAQAWESLLRTLRAGISRIEDAGDEDVSKAKGLEPDPVPLNLKIILVGKEEVYDMLLNMDERFSKLFKIKAHLTEDMPRNRNCIRSYLAHLRRIIDDDNLLHFDRHALAALVDYGSRLIEDQQKLTLRFPRLREIMVEASAYAEMDGKTMVDSAIMSKTLKARNFRSNLVEEAFLEEYDRRIIKVHTDGEAVGKVNGLAVSMYGDFEFGLPHQISCTVGAGNGGIIDLERDAQLGGPIHTKAMMILKSYLVSSFAHNKPLVLTGSLGIEQNYVGIEGDSASGAELAALLSALSGVPVRLSLAFTGAVGQSGEIMAVGGVTRKIEGFFEVCKRHGLTGKQGVIMPQDNLPHVILNDEVIEAVEQKQFHVYPVEHITEAMEILTGLPSGRLRKDGTYSQNSLYRKVDKRLKELTEISTRAFRRR